MKTLSVRMEDDDFEQLQRRAEAASASSTSDYVRALIASSGGGEVVPNGDQSSGRSTGGSSAASPPPPAAIQYDTAAIDPRHETGVADPAPSFLAAPVDDCGLCGHDRQASSHLGGQPCKYKIGRRNCNCTFEGF